jgi:hypothetical protein
VATEGQGKTDHTVSILCFLFLDSIYSLNLLYYPRLLSKFAIQVILRSFNGACRGCTSFSGFKSPHLHSKKLHCQCGISISSSQCVKLPVHLQGNPFCVSFFFTSRPALLKRRSNFIIHSRCYHQPNVNLLTIGFLASGQRRILFVENYSIRFAIVANIFFDYHQAMCLQCPSASLKETSKICDK